MFTLDSLAYSLPNDNSGAAVLRRSSGQSHSSLLHGADCTRLHVQYAILEVSGEIDIQGLNLLFRSYHTKQCTWQATNDELVPVCETGYTLGIELHT